MYAVHASIVLPGRALVAFSESQQKKDTQIFGLSNSYTNRGFARRGTHLYAQDLGFLFVWRGIEKNNEKRIELLIYFTERFKISIECVC